MASCAPRTEIPSFTPSASARASLQWKTGRSSTQFEAVFARSAEGLAALDLYKGAPSPVLSVRMTPSGDASISGPAARRSWHGNRSTAPPELTLLLAILSLYTSEESLTSGSQEMHMPTHQIAYSKPARRLTGISARSLDVEAVITVEFF